MKKNNKKYFWIGGIVVIIIILGFIFINNNPKNCNSNLDCKSGQICQIVGTEKVCLINNVPSCTNSYRLVQYKPLDVIPEHLVTNINSGGNGCVLKEQNVASYLANPTPFINECNHNFVQLDGVVIVGGYNISGQTSGSETYYIDLPFCI